MAKKNSKNKLLKIILISLGVLIGMVLLASLIFVPIVKRKAINYVEENTEYRLKINSIVFTGFHSVVITGVDMRPKAEIKDFYKDNKLERDWMGIKTEISISGIDWGALLRHKKVFAESIVLSDVDLFVYRDKRQPDGPYKYKALPAKILRNTSFIFTVPQAEIKRFRIEYHEIQKDGTPIKVIFSQLYGTLYHLSSDSNYIKENPEVILDGKGLIMDTIKATMQYKFNTLSRDDKFTFEGHVERFSASTFNRCITPALTGIEITDGEIKKVDLFFHGDDSTARGKMKIEYEELKVDILSKKEPGRKSKFKTFLSRILIDKENKKEEGELDETGKIYCARGADRFIFNYWWRAIKSGILSSVVEIPVPQQNPDKKDKRNSRKQDKKVNRKQEQGTK